MAFAIVGNHRGLPSPHQPGLAEQAVDLADIPGVERQGVTDRQIRAAVVVVVIGQIAAPQALESRAVLRTPGES